MLLKTDSSVEPHSDRIPVLGEDLRSRVLANSQSMAALFQPEITQNCTCVWVKSGKESFFFLRFV